MNERYFRNDIVVRLQRLFWRLVFFVFAVATGLYAVAPDIAEIVTLGGVIATLLIVAILTITIAELFRKANLYRFWLLSYMLLLILLSIIVLETYFT